MIPCLFAQGPHVHLVKPHGARPALEGRGRLRSICGKRGTVVAELTMRIGAVCPHCKEIEVVLARPA